jgi:RNA polymerase sigma factor FliA
MTRTEDAELMARFLATRDPAHREEVILRYVPLVHFVLGCLGISRSMNEHDDLVSQGLLGLVEAADHFDPACKTQFSTYATLRIRGRILDYLRSIDWLPRTARARARAVDNATFELWGQLHHEPSDEELAQRLGYDMETLLQAHIDSSRVILSLDTLLESDAENASLYEAVADPAQKDPSETADDKAVRSEIVDALHQITERERTVLSLYYYEELTLKEIGSVLGISESRVCQLHSRAVTNLKSILETKRITSAATPTTAAPMIVRDGADSR